jgi:peptide/nickel transport system permease protein
MLRLIGRRLAIGVLVALTVMTLAFLLTRLSGDLAVSIAGPAATQADVEIVRKAYGLDRPLYVQFFAWVGRAMIGDFGQSYFFKDSVANLIQKRLPITLTLGLVGLSLALIVSIPLGILAALRENTWIDRSVTMFTMVGQAVPSFWLALILMIVLGLQFGILPISGTGTWQHFVMPGIVLAFTAIPALTRLTRSGMIEAMASDYIRTARAKGLSRARIVFKHALRNAAIPVVSIAAVQLGFMLGGSIVIETVFALHGVGYLGWESIAKNDFPVVQAVVLVLAVFYIGLTLLADILNALLDPRLRTGRANRSPVRRHSLRASQRRGSALRALRSASPSSRWCWPRRSSAIGWCRMTRSPRISATASSRRSGWRAARRGTGSAPISSGAIISRGWSMARAFRF